MTVRADEKEFRATLRLDTPREREYVRHGGILPYVLRRLLGYRAQDRDPLSRIPVARKPLKAPASRPRAR